MSKKHKYSPSWRAQKITFVLVVSVAGVFAISGIAVSNALLASKINQATPATNSRDDFEYVYNPSSSPSINPSYTNTKTEPNNTKSQTRVINLGEENEFQDDLYRYSFRYPQNWISNDFTAESPDPNLLRIVFFKNPSEPDQTRGGMTLTINPRSLSDQLAWLKEHGEGKIVGTRTLLVSGQKAVEFSVEGMQWSESEQKTVTVNRTLVLIPLQDKTLTLAFTPGSVSTTQRAYRDIHASIISSLSIH